MRFLFSRRGAAVLIALGLAAHPAPGQELAARAVHASSPNPELPGPDGFGLSGQVASGDWLFRIDFTRYAQETVKAGTVCRVYSPRVDCGTEEVSTSASMSGLRLGVLRTVGVGSAVRVGVGGGLSLSALSTSAWGVSGRRADLSAPRTAQPGYLGMLSVDVAPLRGVPLRVVATATAHWVRFEGCADPTEETSGYAPFCGTDRFRELAVGLSWELPGMFGRS